MAHLAKDVGLWTSSCLRCHQSKIQSHVKSSVPRILVPGRRVSHVHLDLVGPWPSCQGFSYLLTMIDRTSRWPEAVPLSSITGETCARAFISTWVSKFEVPALLTTDRGSQFTSSFWLEVCSILGILRILTTSFHPQSNGMIVFSSLFEILSPNKAGRFRLVFSPTSGIALPPGLS